MPSDTIVRPTALTAGSMTGGNDPDAGAAGRALRAIHEALVDYDGALPAFGHPEETNAMLDTLPPGDDVDLVRAIAARRPSVTGQPLHGDAQLFNCLGSPSGPFDDVTALPIQIFGWVSDPRPEYKALAAAGIIVLMAILLAMNAVAIWLRNKYEKKW